MKKNITLFLLCAIIYSANAQTTFQIAYGATNDYDKCYVAKTNNGGYAIAGTTSNFGAGWNDVYLVRTDDSGNLLWTKTFGGAQWDVATSIQTTSDDGFIISGITVSFGDGGDDFYLIRTDADGNLVWSKTFGSTGNDDAHNAIQTADGGFLVAGIGGTSLTNIIKTNSAGDTLWTKIIDAGNPFSMIQNADKGFTMCGSVYTNQSNGPDMSLYRTDSLGNIIWYSTYGGSSSEAAYQFIKANDGGYISIGITQSFGAGSDDLYVVKTDSVGVLVWSKAYGTPGIDDGSSIVSTGNGYMLLGRTAPNNAFYSALLIRIDNTGNLVSAKKYLYTGISGNLVHTDDSGFIISSNNADGYLIKTDSLGNSGCNDSTTSTIVVTNAATTVGTYTNTYFSGITTGDAATVVSSGGTATIICLTEGLGNEISTANSISIYPNPVSDQLTVNMPGATLMNGEIEVTDVLGRSAFVQKVNGNEVTIDVHQLITGIYFLQLKSNDRTIAVKKFMKSE